MTNRGVKIFPRFLHSFVYKSARNLLRGIVVSLGPQRVELISFGKCTAISYPTFNAVILNNRAEIVVVSSPKVDKAPPIAPWKFCSLI